MLLTLHGSRRGICVRCLCFTIDEVVSHTHMVLHVERIPTFYTMFLLVIEKLLYMICLCMVELFHTHGI